MLRHNKEPAGTWISRCIIRHCQHHAHSGPAGRSRRACDFDCIASPSNVTALGMDHAWTKKGLCSLQKAVELHNTTTGADILLSTKAPSSNQIGVMRASHVLSSLCLRASLRVSAKVLLRLPCQYCVTESVVNLRVHARFSAASSSVFLVPLPRVKGRG
jgi:hypothetical protein